VPPPDFFRKHGLLLKTGFLEPALCAEYSRRLRAAAATRAEVFGRDLGGAVRPAVRNAWEAELSGSVETDIARRIDALRPELADHFGLTLGASEGPSFLVYRTGGFYRPHHDLTPGHEDSSIGIGARRVSIVIFLNAMSTDPGPGEYAGGLLTFYGLIDDPAWQAYGFALEPAPGLLVAFPSDLVHEVTPVAAGERYTIVDWCTR
jgi:predicted 2-oxoglutarate/Fe(II)-dependent dioxygenase YbiX